MVEAQTDGIPPAFFFPDADEALVARHTWLAPHFTGEGEHDRAAGAGVRRRGGGPHRRRRPLRGQRQDPVGAVVDRPGLAVHGAVPGGRLRPRGGRPRGPHPPPRRPPGLGLHRDGDRWVPTFPNARYLYVGAELDSLRTDADPDVPRLRAEVLDPVFDAGLADVVGADADLGDGLRLAPTPGHTPGHASLWLGGGADALVTGDAVVHPLQVRRARPRVRRRRRHRPGPGHPPGAPHGRLRRGVAPPRQPLPHPPRRPPRTGRRRLAIPAARRRGLIPGR